MTPPQAKASPAHTELSLYVDPRSSACLRVLAWLRHKGLTLPLHRVDILAGEHRDPAQAQVFATRSVPVLALGPDGPWLSQSLAILLHLEAAFPEPPTLPADAAARGKVLEICACVASELHAPTNLRIRRHVGARWGDEEATAWNRHWAQQGLEVLEALVARGAPDAFAVGDTLTLADFFLWPALRNALRGGVALAPYPRLDALVRRYGTLGCFIAVVPGG